MFAHAEASKNSQSSLEKKTRRFGVWFHPLKSVISDFIFAHRGSSYNVRSESESCMGDIVGASAAKEAILVC
eukprot:UN01932